MLKKILSVLLLFALVFCLFGCGNETETEVSESAAVEQQTEEAVVDEKETEDENTQTPTTEDSTDYASMMEQTAPADLSVEGFTGEAASVDEAKAKEAEAVKGYTFTGETEPGLTVCRHILYASGEASYMYDFSFAPDGSTIEIATTQTGEDATKTTVYFNADGKIESIINGSGRNTFYTYDGNKVTMKYFADGEDEDGKTVSSELYYMVYTMNENNKPLTIETRLTDDSLYSTETYTYNENGKCTKYTSSGLNGESETIYTYNEAGKVIEKQETADGDFYSHYVYEYNENNEKIREISYYSETTERVKTDVRFADIKDAQGNLVKRLRTSTNVYEDDFTATYTYTDTVYQHYVDFIDSYYIAY